MSTSEKRAKNSKAGRGPGEREGGVMTTQRNSEALRVCRRIVIHLRGAGRRVAAAVSDRFGGRRGAGGGAVDVLDIRGLQLALADELETMRAGLESWDDRCECERERAGGLRRRRNNLELALRERLRRLKNGLTGAFDDAAASKLVRPVRQLATAPAELQRQAERLHAALTDPELELPAPRPGVEIDLALAAASVEQPAAELGRTLAALADCEAGERHARARRDEERDGLEDFSGKVGRFESALRDLAEHRPASIRRR